MSHVRSGGPGHEHLLSWSWSSVQAVLQVGQQLPVLAGQVLSPAAGALQDALVQSAGGARGAAAFRRRLGGRGSAVSTAAGLVPAGVLMLSLLRHAWRQHCQTREVYSCCLHLSMVALGKEIIEISMCFS